MAQDTCPVNFDDAQMRLAIHSNVPGTNLSEHESFVFHLWQADQSRSVPKLDLCDDVIACLEVVNREWNGPLPSESKMRIQNRQLPTDLVYSVSGIISSGLRYRRRWSRNGRFDSSICDWLEDSTYRIAYAWDQVIAGDIDDILEGFDIDSAI
jgi:hypothetical protein